MSTIRLCFDSGPGCGLGHQRRMEALAAALDQRGAKHDLRAIAGPVDADLLVVDSYLHRADDPAVCTGRHIGAVDDLGRDLDVDVVVNPVPSFPGRTDHKARSVLVGLQHALVDPTLAAEVDHRPPEDPVREVLVTTGGTDVAGLGAHMAKLLATALPSIQIRQATGPWGSTEVPPGVEQVDGRPGIRQPLAEADIVVTAGGVTMLEAMCLGRPVVAVMTADNQRRYLQTAQRERAVVWTTADDVAAAVRALVDDPARRSMLSRRGRALIDGRGADRVAEALLGLL